MITSLYGHINPYDLVSNLHIKASKLAISQPSMKKTFDFYPHQHNDPKGRIEDLLVHVLEEIRVGLSK